LSPVFVIGGVYPIANPLFLGRIELKGHAGRWELSAAPLKEALVTTWNGQPMQAFTRIGITSGVFANETELAAELGETGSVEQFFAAVHRDVEAAFGACSA
jgi:CRISPR-associated protein Cst2